MDELDWLIAQVGGAASIDMVFNFEPRLLSPTILTLAALLTRCRKILMLRVVLSSNLAISGRKACKSRQYVRLNQQST